MSDTDGTTEEELQEGEKCGNKKTCADCVLLRCLFDYFFVSVSVCFVFQTIDDWEQITEKKKCKGHRRSASFGQGDLSKEVREILKQDTT